MKQLSEMTIEELREQKKAWYKDAKDTGKLSALRIIGEELGDNLNHRYGPKYLFAQNGIEIYVDNYGHYMTVSNGDKRVCSTHPCDQLFIPGEWYDGLSSLYDLAALKKESRELLRKEQERSALLRELS